MVSLLAVFLIPEIGIQKDSEKLSRYLLITKPQFFFPNKIPLTKINPVMQVSHWWQMTNNNKEKLTIVMN